MIVSRTPIEGIRQMERKLLKNGTIMQRVCGKGKMFTWMRYGTLPPGQTPEHWLAMMIVDGYEVVSRTI